MEKLSELLLRFYPLAKVTFKRRILVHSIFWGFMFWVYWFGIGFPSDTIIYKFITSISFTISGIIFFYTLTYFIIKIDRNKKGIKKYIYIMVSLIFFYFIMAKLSYFRVQLIIENDWLSAKSNRMYGVIENYYKEGFWAYFKVTNILTDTLELSFTTLPAFFLKFLRIFSRNLIEKKQLEIDFLRLQINPHFLTNTLNNIYSLVVTEDKRSADAILSLSNLLDYVLYESSYSKVSLEKEITFLKDFIELERIRSSQRVSIEFTTKGDLHGEIAPLILIAFIENAFKHGFGDSTKANYININVSMIDDTLSFSIINSKPNIQTEKRKTSIGGIGLTNTKRRLESLYPKRYEITIKNDHHTHEVLLLIQLISKN
jgi:two-component system, LytTR family, sensor kinase